MNTEKFNAGFGEIVLTGYTAEGLLNPSDRIVVAKGLKSSSSDSVLFHLPTPDLESEKTQGGVDVSMSKVGQTSMMEFTLIDNYTPTIRDFLLKKVHAVNVRNGKTEVRFEGGINYTDHSRAVQAVFKPLLNDDSSYEPKERWWVIDRAYISTDLKQMESTKGMNAVKIMSMSGVRYAKLDSMPIDILAIGGSNADIDFTVQVDGDVYPCSVSRSTMSLATVATAINDGVGYDVATVTGTVLSILSTQLGVSVVFSDSPTGDPITSALYGDNLVIAIEKGTVPNITYGA